jgi:hypothetical protein
MSKVDYKAKYLELRNVLTNSVDVAFRAGYQQGYKDAQAEGMQQQLAQAQQQAQMMNQQGMDPSMEDQNSQYTDGMADQQADGSMNELEAGMGELENELNKGEIDKASALNQLQVLSNSLRKLQEAASLKKSNEHIEKLKNATKKVEKFSLGYKNNLSNTHKKALSAQQQIVTGILKKWEKEEVETSKNILDVLASEGKIK